MKIFTTLYDKALIWSKHKKAPIYLSGLSFAESSFFPIPPDVMLMPMSLARPEKAFYYAWLTTIFSILGGVLGYVIGYLAMDLLMPIIESLGYQSKIATINDWFAEYGVWIVFIAGFSPIPYKLFTIAAGATAMAFLPFIIASFIGRGARFFLVAGLMRWGGQKFETTVRKWVDWIGWTLVVLIFIYIAYKMLGSY
ncbi:YqaA family protein [Thiomicrorhabdus lithotrophica]|uniref:DedA family protein n=1 Tax=Thiomicrorhabdus lithotrophica TaxID=2949997 RepID=A0ABY8CAE7_9GAMM|nr:YqaA family protein [Thiomicrorhabdus lithotrophica]WEJ61546.1 DedA family protein [Thiomicrorhabdus lithotrophica]